MPEVDKILPNIFIDLFEKNFLIGVVQFGSSLTKNIPQDIDLVVIVRKGRLRDFIAEIEAFSLIDPIYDISLVLEEEIENKNKFNFGGHGVYLVESFRVGKTLIGINPFLTFPKMETVKVKTDIVERMKEYVYVLRKSYFVPTLLSKFESRYLKCLKLAYYILSSEEVFPDVLGLSEEECLSRLNKLGYTLKADKRLNIEFLWEQIRKQYL